MQRFRQRGCMTRGDRVLRIVRRLKCDIDDGKDLRMNERLIFLLHSLLFNG